jgi:hypothetical protein
MDQVLPDIEDDVFSISIEPESELCHREEMATRLEKARLGEVLG